jgi:hypothetical protein
MVDDLDIPPDGHLARVLAALTDDDRQLDPPATRVWDAIALELGIAETPAENTDLASVVPLTPKGRWGLAFIVGAAALVAMVASFAAWRAVSEEDDLTVIASTQISSEGLGTASPLAGRAELVEEGGQLYIQLDVSDLPSPGGYIEAWLIDPNVEGMYPLGAVDGDVRLPVPHGVEPTDFPIVDLSIEPLDGDPTHSGVSILRGVLPF